MKHLWGIDLGGTKIEGIILEPGKTTTAICRMRIPSEAEKGYEHVTGQIVKLIEMMKTASGLKPERLGMGTPGILDPLTQTMKNCNSVCLNGMPLKADIERMLGIPVELANDANCFALAETLYGAVHDECPDAKVVFGVIMGTGVGGGIVFDKKVWGGKQGIAGEWGHNILEEGGAPCFCGKSGDVESTISGPALEKYYTKISGKKLSMKEIAELHYAGKDEYATATINRLTAMFGKAISVIVNVLDPDAIVIGGGVGNIDAVYTDGLKELKKHIFNNRVETILLKPKLGDSAGVFGAAGLVA
jgi:predicted NBD/HSP70 family sugar kinase